jgi:membrane-associated phospholipid phosphatase
MAEPKTKAEKKVEVQSAEPAHTPVEAAATAVEELSYSARFLKKHGWRLLPVFFGLLIPTLLFATLVDEYREDGIFFFDKPVLLSLHAITTPALDELAVLVSNLGYLWGVVPFNVALLAILVVRKRYREGLFFALAVGGSALLNLAAKGHYARMRPDFWQQIVDEHSYSFPSGHAMGSATLATALVLLAWRTRWHWPALVLLPVFALLVGVARMYLGVHYPSDILAGFAISVAWVFAMHQVVGRAPRPKAEPADSQFDDKAAAGKAATAKAR